MFGRTLRELGRGIARTLLRPSDSGIRQNLKKEVYVVSLCGVGSYKANVMLKQGCLQFIGFARDCTISSFFFSGGMVGTALSYNVEFCKRVLATRGAVHSVGHLRGMPVFHGSIRGPW